MGCALVALPGPLLKLPAWLSGVSPFQHVPQLPAEQFAAAGPAVLLAVAVALLAVGMTGLRRRDVG